MPVRAWRWKKQCFGGQVGQRTRLTGRIGRPGLPTTRLYIIKHVWGSRSGGLRGLGRDPLLPGFCGARFSSTGCPLDRKSMTRWLRIGAERLEPLLADTP